MSAPVAVIIEDEPQIRRFVRSALEAEGWQVHEAGTAQRGLTEAGTRKPDLLVLDLGLPDGDGLDVIRDVRGWSAVPIIVLSARVDEADKIAALDAGADDYLTKPFALEELLARMRALLRRITPTDGEDEETLAFADLTMNVASRDVHRGERAIELTRTEFTLLEMFLRRPRRVLERSFILEEVWGFDFPTTANSLEVYVGYLRRKTEAADEPRLIQTVRGVGYVLKES